MKSYIIVTQDYYLYFSLKQLYPDLRRHHEKIDHTSSDDCVIMIDCREFLCNIEDAYKMTRKSLFNIKIVLLGMNRQTTHRSTQQLISGIDLSQPIEVVQSSIEKVTTGKTNKYSTQVIKIHLEKSDILMIDSFLSGKKTPLVATELGRDIKGFYRYRNEFSKFFGTNFNQACWYIFKNELLTKSYRLPKHWFNIR